MRRRIRRLLPPAFLLAALILAAAGVLAVPVAGLSEDSGRPQPAPAAGLWKTIDWDTVGEEAAGLLARYISIDTTNPPGNETAAARFLVDTLKQHGLRGRIAESAPGRGNVYARRKGRGERAIVLLHHLDVVPAEPSEWTVPPFSGRRRDGFVYGRGALDCKGIGIAQLMALILLERHRVSLAHDIVLLGTADEETGGSLGAEWVIHERPNWLKGVITVLNEGDHIHLGGARPIVQIAVAEKAPCWLRVIARGTGGHGSTPPSETSVTRLIRALGRVTAHEPPLRVVPAVASYFAAIAPSRDEPVRSRLLDLRAALVDPRFRADFEADPWQYALVHNTVTPTVLAGSPKTNVIPSVASADLDCRLLPGEDDEAFVAELQRVIGDPEIEVTRLLSSRSPASSEAGPLMDAIRTIAGQELDQPLVVGSVSTGFTDSRHFRAFGVPSYGFAPFAQHPDERRRIHGADERLSVRVLSDAVRFLFRVLIELG